jgi:hypothetical protein
MSGGVTDVEILCPSCPSGTPSGGVVLGMICAACLEDLAFGRVLGRGLSVSDEQRRTLYDRGFRRAVARGHLTERQAIERGSRAAFAHKLIYRHRMSVRLATFVADNKVPLLVALRLTARRRRKKKKPASRTSWFEVSLLITVLVCFAMLVLGVLTISDDVAMPGPVSRVPVREATNSPAIQVANSVRRNYRGELTQVVASTPMAVLETFCTSLGDGARAVRVIAVRDHWVGLYRQYGRMREIPIKKGSRQQGFLTGDAQGPIVEDSQREPG